MSSVGHFWSLAVEEQFYFVWPAMVLLVPESALLWLCMLVPVASTALRSMPVLQEIARTQPEVLYRMTFFRLDGLALGACAAVVARNRKLARAAVPVVRRLVVPFSVAALAMMVAAEHSAYYTGRWMSTCGYSVIALLYSSVLLLIVLRSAPTDFLRSGWLMSFGKYSYGIYVFHVPILFLLIRLIRMGGLPGFIVTLPIGVATSFVLAYLSWHLYEVRFHRLKDRVAPALDRTQAELRARASEG